MSEKNSADVLVTGAGVVSALGHTIDQFWQRALAGESSVAAIPEHWSQFYESKSKYWSPLELPDFSAHGIGRAARLSQDVNVLNSIVAADEALLSAGLLRDRSGANPIGAYEDRFRIGVFVGTGLGCITSTLDNFVPHLLKPPATSTEDASFHYPSGANSYLENVKRVSPFASIMSMGNSIAAQLSIRYQVKGPVETNLHACASGAYAIHRGFQSLSSDEIDIAICGGSEFYGDYSGAIFMAFDKLGALVDARLPASLANRPFDRERSGFLFSEGASCFVILEKKASIRRDVDPLARIVASKSNADSYSLAAISKEKNAIKRLITDVLADAQLEPEQINYINTHGTGTKQNDEIEAQVIYDLFGNIPLVNSTKSLLGHTIAASGAIEFMVAAKSLQQNKVHGNSNLVEPISPIRLTTESRNADLKYALTQNFGFGGHNVGLILGSS